MRWFNTDFSLISNVILLRDKTLKSKVEDIKLLYFTKI